MEIIIPIHIADKKSIALLEKAIKSVNLKENKSLIVCPLEIKPELVKLIKKFDLNEENILINETGDYCFESQVNFGVSKCEGKYFSILEYDDTYHEKWFENVEKYTTYYPQVSMFMPLGNLYDYKTGKYLGYSNELALSSSFADENGVLTNEMLLTYPTFFPQGCVLKKEDFIKIGGFKKSIKYANWYEFMLRLTFNGNEIHVIPKIGCIHMLNREGSYTDECDKKMTQKEQEAWVNLATKEYFYTNDREKLPVVKDEEEIND